MIRYKDMDTGKVHFTRGRFVEWTEPMGPLWAPYAHVKSGKTDLYIPPWCLTPESRAALPPMPPFQKTFVVALPILPSQEVD